MTRLLVLIPLALVPSSAIAETLSQAVLKLTGSRTRIVWLHAVRDVPASSWDAVSADYELKGFATTGDFGATHGDKSDKDTMLRSHWNNQNTGICNDEVIELMMQPANWGEITFQP